MATLGFIGEKLDLIIRQGATFGPVTITRFNPDGVTPIDLTGSVIRAHLRKKALDATLVTEFAVVITDASGGKFEFGLSAEVTAAIIAGESVKDAQSVYVWDMEHVDTLGRVLPMYYGDVKVFREVTRTGGVISGG